MADKETMAAITEGLVNTDTPTGGGTDEGQTPKGETPSGDQTPTGQEPGSPPGKETGASGEGTPTSEGKKPPPYDQDPKWKAARAAEKALNDILSAHGFDTPDELQAALDEGMTLKEVLGQEDANTVVAEARKMREVEAYWAEREAAEREAKETPEETIERLKREKADLAEDFRRKQEDSKTVEEGQRILKEYDEEVTKLATSVEGLSKSERNLLTLVLGVDNPANEIDISDKSAVKATAKTVAERVQTILQAIRQEAVDQYAAGKSGITPTTGKGVEKPAVEKPPLETPAKGPGEGTQGVTSDMDVADTFAAANKEFLAILSQAAAE